MDFRITFWGVRGSKPTPGKNTVLFGGNTPCVQIEAGRQNLIFDGGTGLVELGRRMLETKGRKEAAIFFSHLHWDHIQGLPFFAPFFVPGNHFRLYGEDKKDMSFRQIIEQQMAAPYFPITMETMRSSYEFVSIVPDQSIDLGQGLRVKTFAVDHPNGCLCYRIEKGSAAVVYCTDTGPLTTERNVGFLDFLRGADLLIYDAYFTDEEFFQDKEDWGHSTWQEGTRISKEAGIGHLLLYHHQENRSDQAQQQIEAFARQEFANTAAAREGMVITIGGERPEKVAIDYPY